MQSPATAQIIRAPERRTFRHATTLFLAGTTPRPGQPDWRAVVVEATAGLPVTLLDPVRPDWDGSWVEDVSFAPFREQVAWELDMQEAADLVAFFFHPHKDGMISLLELGLCARASHSVARIVVACPPGYVKRGNVQMICQRFGLCLVESVEDLAAELAQRIRRRMGRGSDFIHSDTEPSAVPAERRTPSPCD